MKDIIKKKSILSVLYWHLFLPVYQVFFHAYFRCLVNKCLKNNRKIKFNLDSVLNSDKKLKILIRNGSQHSLQSLPKVLNASLEKDYSQDINCAMIWGVRPGKHRLYVIKQALKHNLPLIIAEDSFLRSRDIGASGEIGCGIIFDSYGIYYDASYLSSIEHTLASDWKISQQDLTKSNQAMALIKNKKVSKYNIRPHQELTLPGENKHKVLVVDQRKGDQSIKGAKANDKTFVRMLQDAIKENPNSDIIIKTHPDGNSGKFGGYYQNYEVKLKNVYKFTENTNPVSLLEKIDKIYVCSSGMGLEACILGKEVACYGAPVYSNYGFTDDRGFLRTRVKNRTIEEVFFVSYIKYSRYISPLTHKPCDITQVIEGLADLNV